MKPREPVRLRPPAAAACTWTRIETLHLPSKSLGTAQTLRACVARFLAPADCGLRLWLLVGADGLELVPRRPAAEPRSVTGCAVYQEMGRCNYTVSKIFDVDVAKMRQTTL